MKILLACFVCSASTLLSQEVVPEVGLRQVGPPGAVDCSTVQPGVPGPNAHFARWTDIDYTGPSVSSHCGQRYNVFVPEGEQPTEGWPALIFLDNSGFRHSRRMAFLDSDNPAHQRAAIAYEVLTDDVLPMVVVFASSTISRGGASGNPVSDDVYNPWQPSPAYGAAYPGNGLFVPPGRRPGASGTSAYHDLQRPMPEKDAVMIVQHVKHNAGALPPGVPGAIQIDLSRIAVYGSSAAASILMWPVLDPDRAAETFPDAVPGSQEQVDTHVPAAILLGGVVSWPRFVPGELLSGLPTGLHFPVASNDGSGPQDIAAGTLGEVSHDILVDASPLYYTDDGAGGPISTHNAKQQLFVTYTEPSSVPGQLCFEKSPVEASLGDCWFAEGLEQFRHSSWSGHALKMRFPNTFLMTTPSAAYTRSGFPVSADNLPEALPDRITSIELMAREQRDWLASQLLGPRGRWSDLAGGLAGSTGVPLLEGAGSIKPNSALALVLSRARAGAPVLLIVGSVPIYQPFMGGTLVPAPELVTLGIPPTDADGRLVVSSLLPSTPVMGSTYFQFWIEDRGAPAGLSASNAIVAVAP